MVSEIRDVAHLRKPGIGPPGDKTCGNSTVIRFLFGVAPNNVRKGFHKLAVLIDEMHHVADVHLFERIEQGVVDGFTATGILEGPMNMLAASFDFQMLVLTRGDTPLARAIARALTTAMRCSSTCSRAARWSWMCCFRIVWW